MQLCALYSHARQFVCWCQSHATGPAYVAVPGGNSPTVTVLFAGVDYQLRKLPANLHACAGAVLQYPPARWCSWCSLTRSGASSALSTMSAVWKSCASRASRYFCCRMRNLQAQHGTAQREDQTLHCHEREGGPKPKEGSVWCAVSGAEGRHGQVKTTATAPGCSTFARKHAPAALLEVAGA